MLIFNFYICFYRLSYIPITTKGISVLLDALEASHSKIRWVDLNGIKIEDDYLDRFGKYVQTNDSLIGFALSDTDISDKGIEILSNTIVNNVTLKKIELRNNMGITDKSSASLIKILQNSHVEAIDTDKTSIQNRSTVDVFVAINKLKLNHKKLVFDNK